MNKQSIKNWAIDDRPREKLALKGAENLSNSELLAILINNGSVEKVQLTWLKNYWLLWKTTCSGFQNYL